MQRNLTMLLPFPSSADVQTLADFRAGAAQPLRRPRELTPSLYDDYGTPVGYSFSWGQLLESASPLPDPTTERYTGLSWTIIPSSVWRDLLPRVRGSGWHLYHLLNNLWHDTAECLDTPVPTSVYIQCTSRIELATITTLCGEDAEQARAWIAHQFLPHDLPHVLFAYQSYLTELLELRREWWLTEQHPEGGAQ